LTMIRLRYSSILGLVVFSALVLALVAPVAAQQSGMIVNASRVNLRSGPGAGFPSLAQLEFGQLVTPISRNSDGSWVQVQLIGGLTGWVNARYLQSSIAVGSLPVTQQTGSINAAVTSSFLNVRSGPGANFPIVGRLAYGAALNLVGRNTESSWAQVSVPGGVQGWVSTRYIAASVLIDSLPVTSNTGVSSGFPQPVPSGGQTGTVTSRGLSVRYGPGLGYGRFTIARQGEGVSLIGRNGDGTWLLVQLANGLTGWVNSGFIFTSFPIFSLEVRG
jgi:uncharacterized protein YraI